MTLPSSVLVTIFIGLSSLLAISGFQKLPLPTASRLSSSFCRTQILSSFAVDTAPATPTTATAIATTATAIATTTTTTTTIDISEDASRDISTMEEWAAACGVQWIEGFHLTASREDSDVPGLDVFAATLQDTPAYSPVLYVPSEMVLSSNRAYMELHCQETEDVEKLLQEVNAKEDQLRQYYLMLKILTEYEKGETSPWYPWLNSLPRYFSNAASMTPFCFKCLPTYMASLARKERANLNNLRFRRVSFLSEEIRSNEELWTWAYQIVITRSFEANDGSGDLRFAPMADMFNHGTVPNIEIGYDDEGNCHVQATTDIPAGSPLCMSYGDPTNPSFLFARYGFVDESSPATFCKIMPAHVSDEMKDMGYAQDRMLFFKDTGEVSEEVFDLLLYKHLRVADAELKTELYRAHMSGDYQTKQALHEQFYPETAAKLLEHIDNFLKLLDDLSKKAENRDIKEHPRLPLIMRHNAFVRRTFLAVRARYFGP